MNSFWSNCGEIIKKYNNDFQDGHHDTNRGHPDFML